MILESSPLINLLIDEESLLFTDIIKGLAPLEFMWVLKLRTKANSLENKPGVSKFFLEYVRYF